MRTIQRRVAFMLTLLLAFSIFFLPGCSDNPITGYTLGDDGYYRNDAPEAIAIILGNHACAMAIPEDAFAHIGKQLENVVYGGYACVIIADSHPTKVELTSSDPDMFQQNAKNTDTLRDYIDARRETLLAAVKKANVPGTEEEVDLLQSIREAVNALNNLSARDIEKKQIIIVDTGISTAGTINFVDEMKTFSDRPDPNSIIKRLQDHEGGGLLPDLSGIVVRFIGTGDGMAEPAAPQQLEPTDKRYLLEFWTEVVTSCGAVGVEHDIAAGWDTPNEYLGEDEGTVSPYRYVSAVTFHHESPFVVPPTGDDPNKEPEEPERPTMSLKLGEKLVAFESNEYTKYKNEAAVIAILRPFVPEICGYLSRYPEEYIWIFGTTASVEKPEGNPQWAQGRGETLKGTLVELGVPEEKLLVVGLGAIFPWYDRQNLSENRAVYLSTGTEDSELYMEVKQWYDEEKLAAESMEWFRLALEQVKETEKIYE